MYKSPIFLNAGDKAIVVELGDSINPDVNRMVHSLNNKISSFNINGIIDSVPSYKSILIMFFTFIEIFINNKNIAFILY